MTLELSGAAIASFLAILALATYIQTNAGFAFGLVMIGLSSALNILPIPMLALLVSGLSLVNSTTALKGNRTHVDWQLLRQIMMGCVPGALTGVMLLNALNEHYQTGLKLALGLSIIGCGIAMFNKPQPQPQPSAKATVIFTGLLAGVLGGLFSVFGPPLAFLLYRQPIPLNTVIYSLLAVFSITSILRLGFVAGTTGIDNDFYPLLLIGIPWIYLCTRLSKRFPPPISESRLRQCAFALLIFSGISICHSAFSG